MAPISPSGGILTQVKQRAEALTRLSRTHAVSTFVFVAAFVAFIIFGTAEGFAPEPAAAATLCATQTITSFTRWRGDRLGTSTTIRLAAWTGVSALAGIGIAISGYAFHAGDGWERRAAALFAVFNCALAGVWICIVAWAARRGRSRQPAPKSRVTASRDDHQGEEGSPSAHLPDLFE